MLQIIDVKWKILESQDKYIPILKFRDTDSKEEKDIELTNYNLKFKLSEGKYCVGYFQGGEFKPCPLNSKIEQSTYTQCQRCESLQGFKSAFLFGEEPNENASKTLSQDYYIYLAYFVPGIIKVGTAASSRKFIRPIEQDALIYCYIAENDGFNIQKLEHSISKELKFPETVRSSHKFKFLGRRPNFENAKEELLSSYKRIYDRFISKKDFKSWLFESEKIKVVDLSKRPEIFYPETEVKLVDNDLNLFGQYKGLRGRYLIIENDIKLYAFDIRVLIGRTVENISDYQYKFETDQLGFEI